MLVLDNLSCGYNKQLPLLEHVNYEFKSGVFYALTGKEGSGKTMLLSILGGLHSPLGGQIYFKKKNIEKMGLQAYRRHHAGFIFKKNNLIPYLSALQNVVVAMDIASPTSKHKNELARSILKQLGIEGHDANKKITLLSGIEQQRVAIAREVASGKDILLGDELMGNNDGQSVNEVVDTLATLAHDYQKCVVIITHSKELAKKADKVIILKNGSIL